MINFTKAHFKLSKTKAPAVLIAFATVYINKA